MKVVLLKDFLGNKETDTIEVSDKRGNYLVRMKIAKLENEIVKKLNKKK